MADNYNISLEDLRSDASTFVKNMAEKFNAQESDIRIKYGASSRIVYGKMGKDFREELDEPKLSAMVEAMQQPATGKVKGKLKPIIEISVKDQTVFRQEKNGTVTINQVQLQQEKQESAPAHAASPDVTEADKAGVEKPQIENREKPIQTNNKKLKFADLRQEAEALGLRLERHKTSGYVAYVEGTRDKAHESDRLKNLTDVQNLIEQYREREGVESETTAPGGEQQIDSTEVLKPQPEPLESTPEVEASAPKLEEVEATSPEYLDEVVETPVAELEQVEATSPQYLEEVVETPPEYFSDFVENTTVELEQVEATSPEYLEEVVDTPVAELEEVEVTKLEYMEEVKEEMATPPIEVESRPQDFDLGISDAPPGEIDIATNKEQLESGEPNIALPEPEDKLPSILADIKTQVNLEPSFLPHPETPEQIRTFLESEAEFWQYSDIESGIKKGEVAASFAAEIEAAGVELDPSYRTDIDLANFQWKQAFLGTLEDNSNAGVEQIESAAASNNLSGALEKLNLPAVFVTAAQQIQALPADDVRAMLTDWVSSASKDVFEKVNEGATKAKAFGERLSDLFKDLQSKTTDFTEKAESLRQNTAQTVESIKSWQADQTVAQTALRVYKHHHERMFKDAEYRQQHQGEFNTFKGQKYTITQKGNNFYELASTESKEVLMQFKETFWRLEVKQNTKNLQPQDYREFGQIKEKLNRLGVGEVKGIGQNHYGGMKPQETANKRRPESGISLA